MKRILRLIWLMAVVMLAPAAYASGNSPEAAVGDADKEICFRLDVDSRDSAVAELLTQRMGAIMGRIGCGCEDAEYLIKPSIEVKDVRQTSGMVRDITVAKGSLTLLAVSAKDKDVIWHSETMPLKVMVEDGMSPAEALAKQIKTSDSAYVRFVRVARRKIAESNNSEGQ